MIKSRFYQSQNAPKKLAFLSSKIETFSGKEAQLPSQTPPLVGRGHPLLTPHPFGAFGTSIIAPTALD